MVDINDHILVEGIELYSAEGAARLTGRKPVTIRSLAHRHDLGQRLGRQLVFTQEDIDAIRRIHPLGGRPRNDGTPTHHQQPATDAIRRPARRDQE